MRQRVVSGIQPTGTMHLGNYMGTVGQWVSLQETHDVYGMIADYHSLTTVYADPKTLRVDKWNLAVDLLSAGIDPDKSCLFFQSDVAEHAELYVLLSMITPLSWLERVPTYKSKLDNIEGKDLHTYGFLGYPVLQSADILLYQPDWVPIGKDQLPHLELAREIARRFNALYGPLFKEPAEWLAQYPLLLGIDGRKMSKSYGNSIPVADSDDNTVALVKKMVTDPSRVKRTDKGHPQRCPVYGYHGIFNVDQQEEIAQGCQSAQLGCVDCKSRCAQRIVDVLAPFREKRRYWENQPDTVKDIVAEGAKKARAVALHTLSCVKEIMKI